MSAPRLPPGFRFMPTEPELLKFLKDKLLGRLDELVSHFIIDTVDPYRGDPVFLPKGTQFKHTKQAYFFTNKQQNRAVEQAFWRLSTLHEEVFEGDEKLGFKDTLDFVWSIGNALVQTNWVMHEYSLNPVILSEDERTTIGNRIENYVVCAIQYKEFSFDSFEEMSSDNLSQGESAYK